MTGAVPRRCTSSGRGIGCPGRAARPRCPRAGRGPVRSTGRSRTGSDSRNGRPSRSAPRRTPPRAASPGRAPGGRATPGRRCATTSSPSCRTARSSRRHLPERRVYGGAAGVSNRGGCEDLLTERQPLGNSFSLLLRAEEYR